MRILTSFASVEALRSTGQLASAELDLAESRMCDVIAAFKEGGWIWDPEEHGAFVLVEQGDDVRDFHEVGLNPQDSGLMGAIWEVCYKHDETGLFEVFILYGNDTGWTFIIPDAEWLDRGLRERLVTEAEAYPLRTASSSTEQLPGSS